MFVRPYSFTSVCSISLPPFHRHFFSHIAILCNGFCGIMRWFYLIKRLHDLYSWHSVQVINDVTKMFYYLTTRIVSWVERTSIESNLMFVNLNGDQKKWWCSIVRTENRKLKQNRVIFSSAYIFHRFRVTYRKCYTIVYSQRWEKGSLFLADEKHIYVKCDSLFYHAIYMAVATLCKYLSFSHASFRTYSLLISISSNNVLALVSALLFNISLSRFFFSSSSSSVSHFLNSKTVHH